MKTLADQPFGQGLLWLVAVGLAALALWQASEVIWGYRNLEGTERVRKQITSSAKAVIFAALGYGAGAAAPARDRRARNPSNKPPRAYWDGPAAG